MVYKTYHFGGLSAAQLLPYLQQHLDRLTAEKFNDSHQNTDMSIERPCWYVCWLNNNDEPVIGLLPKTTWTVWTSVTENKACKDSSVIDSEHASCSSNSIPSPQINVLNSRRTFIGSESCSSELSTDICSIKYENNQSDSRYDLWQHQLIEYCQRYQLTDNAHTTNKQTNTDNAKQQATYQHGLMGFIGYDISAQALSPQTDIKTARQPSAYLGHYDIYLRQDKSGEWHLCHHATSENTILLIVAELLNGLNDGLTSNFVAEASSNASYAEPIPATSIHLQPYWQLADYEQAFTKTQDYLYKGDSYQINLTQQWRGLAPVTSTSTSHTLLPHLTDLYHNTKAPFAGYLALTNKVSNEPQRLDSSKQTGNKSAKQSPTMNTYQFELLSCSPELFVTFTKEVDSIKIITKPIKGTRPRGKTAEEDAQLKEALQHSEKDKAENVMIVDLLRNDLGKYAKTGSVQVPHLFAIETFSNVHHMVSTVTATVKQHVHPLTVLFDSLPAGSITGAPKKRSVEIINELEVAARGAYCGTMGYINFDGTGQWNVLIRTLQACQNEVSLWAGGGITVGSECAAEYQECFDKVSNLLHILKQ